MALTTDEWLIWLGVKRQGQSLSQIDRFVKLSKDHIGDYADFQTGVDNQTSYTEWETYLVNQGFSEDDAADFVEVVENNFSDEDESGTSWDEYTEFVVNNTDTYEQYKSNFGGVEMFGSSAQTEDGEPAAGIRVHEEAGVTYEGVSVPPGTTEIFGARVEFSQQAPAVDPVPVEYSNLQVSATEVTKGDTVVVSADAYNPNPFSREVTTSFLVEGQVYDRQADTIPPDTTVNFSFSITWDEYICLDVTIEDLAPQTVCWVPESITQF